MAHQLTRRRFIRNGISAVAISYAAPAFLSDIATLRKRAREHIAQGAVTPGYHADRDVVIKLLNEAVHQVAEELEFAARQTNGRNGTPEYQRARGGRAAGDQRRRPEPERHPYG